MGSSHEYDGSIVDAIVEESKNLTTCWNVYMDILQNGPSRSVHFPPALATMYTEIFNVTNFPGDDDARLAVAMFGNIMFQFGQFCVQQGILYPNLTPCACSEVSDAELENFFKSKE